VAQTARFSLRFLGRWALAALRAGPTAEERQDFHDFVMPGFLRSCQLGCTVLALLAGAWWVLDPFFFAHSAHIRQQYAVFRVGTMLLQLSLAAALTWLPAARRRPLAVAVPVMWANAALVGWFVSGLGGPSTPWFHFVYPTAFFSIPVPFFVVPRLVATGGAAACVVAGYVAFHPAHVHDPFFAIGVSYYVWSVLTGTVLGQMAFRHTVENFRSGRALKQFNATLEERVDAQTEALQALAMHLDQAREAERAHLARELHDELGQELTALRYAVTLAQRRWERDPMSLAPSFADLASLVTRTAETTRSLVSELRPRLLLELGLVSAIEWLVARADAHEGLTVRLVQEGVLPTLDSEVAATVFRVVQEALTNTLRHAEAARVTVRLACVASVLSVSVEDDGQGFDLTARRTHVGLGLVGMRERVRAVGGTFELVSAPGEGTRVSLLLKLTSAETERVPKVVS